MAKAKKSGSPTKGLTKGVHLYRTWVEPKKPIGNMKGKWQYYWVAVAKNSKRICSSTEGYSAKQQCVHSIHVAAAILWPIAVRGGWGAGYTDHTGKKPKSINFS